MRRALAALCAAAFLTGCGDSQQATPPPPAPSAPAPAPASPAPPAAPAIPSGNLRGNAESGGRTYAQYCASCHGPKGHGDGPVAGTLNPKPANHSDHVFMASKSDQDLYQVIAYGGASIGKSPMMAPWKGVINEQGIKDLIAFLRQLSST